MPNNMKIKKFERVSNGNYKITLDRGKHIVLSEEVIINHKLTYKLEITEEEYLELKEETSFYTIYNSCIKYIAYRLRSKKEMYTYLQRKKLDCDLIEMLINKLVENEFIDDDIFAKAFVNDKINFTSSGPYRIKQDLEHNNIDKNIINKYIDNIDKDIILEKINKLIKKYLKANKKYSDYILRVKVYNYLMNLGYYSEDINNCLNNYEF